ncbi:MAG: hypothetical protein AAF958_14900 [Planctomycetota bacterium]
MSLACLLFFQASGDAQEPNSATPSPHEWLEEVMARIVLGPAADAKLRQTVRAEGREFIGVGSFISGGENSGQFRMQVTLHDGQGKHTLSQISDGRLAWTRTAIGESVVVRRVDVSRVQQLLGRTQKTPGTAADDTLIVTPARRIGGVVELLDEVIRHYDLRLRGGRLNGRKVFVASGTLKTEIRESWLEISGGTMPSLQPTSVNVIVAAQDDPATHFGLGWPIRIEYFGDGGSDDPSVKGRTPEAPLISMIELHSIRKRDQVDAEDFRYQNREGDVDFLNDTPRYLKRYGGLR